MSGMYGSCCEEQEAKEAAFRAKIRAATKVSESRMPQMRALKVREDMRRALRHATACDDECCAGCGSCDEDEDASTEGMAPRKLATDNHENDKEFSDSEEEDDDGDEMEAALMARLRQQRMQQLQDGAEEAQRRQSALGTHQRLANEALLNEILGAAGAGDATPILVHLAVVADEAESGGAEQCAWVEEVMRKQAYQFPKARLLTLSCDRADTPPECLGFLRQLPCLVTIEKGVVTSIGAEEIGAMREPDRVQECVRRWLQAQKLRLAESDRRRTGTDDDSDDDGEGDGMSFCGRPGCRKYPHEHVGSKPAGGMRLQEGGPFAR